jgi:CBS domain-containing protein
MNVEELMQRDVATVSPGASLKDAARLLVENHVSGLPVVDEARDVLGVLSETDIVAAEAGGRQTLVGEAMTTPAVTIEADRPVIDAAKLMVGRTVNRLPVVTDGKLVGIITRADLVRAFVRSDPEIAAEIRDDETLRRFWVDAHRVRIEVAEGAVTLSGALDWSADLDLLRGYVRRVPGVVSVRTEPERELGT